MGDLNMGDLIKNVQKKYNPVKEEFLSFKAGDTISVYYEVKEGEKSRIQSFRGVVIKLSGKEKSKTFTIRKLSGSIWVERIFSLSQPSIQKIEIEKKGKVRRAKIYYFRKLAGKKARIKEDKRVVYLKKKAKNEEHSN